MKKAVKIVIMAVFAWSLLGGSFAQADVAGDIRALTGAHSRIVWMHQMSDSAGGSSKDNVLKGIDTDDEKGVRTICGELSAYKNPIITADGNRVVFTRSIPMVCTDSWVVNWDGTGKRRICLQGASFDLWNDPKTGIDWAYVGKASWMAGGPGFFRINIDDTSQVEIVFSKAGITFPWFGISPDGKRAAGCAPWPKNSILSMTNGSAATVLHDSIGRGCHAQIAPDNSGRAFHVFGHSNIDTFDPTGKKIARVYLNDLPGWDQSGVRAYEYYNRWSNDVRFLTFCGPIPNGHKVEFTRDVYIRELNDQLNGVTDRFVRVTNDPTPDRHAHLWIAKGPMKPTFFLAPAALQFSAKQGAVNPAAQTVSITAVGGLPLAGLTAVPDKPWLSITISGTSSEKTLTHLANVKGLAAGNHTSKVTVKAQTVTKNYDVSLKITAVSGISLFGSEAASPVAVRMHRAGAEGMAFHVQLAKAGPFDLQVYDVFGKVIWNYRSPAVEAGAYKLLCSPVGSRLPVRKGVLFVKLTQGAEVAQQRVTVVE